MIIGRSDCLVDLKAEMKLYQLKCLLEEDICRFQTQTLEFYQAKEILEMHMKLVHERPEQRLKCDCDRDTLVKDIIEDDKKALNDKDEEAGLDFPNQLKVEDDAAALKSITENEALQHTEVTDVTLVGDDHDDVIEHFDDENLDKQEAENVAVNEIFKPVGV